jgi:hypothetical protein
LHFGLGTLASASFFAHPLLAASLHLLAAVSYIADSNRWIYLLRRTLPTCRSQNLVVTFPARHAPRRRVVLTAHADAAPTGWLFHPWLARLSSPRRVPRLLSFLRMPLLLATVGLVLAAALDLDAWWHAALVPRRPGLYYGFGLYFAALCLFNLQVVCRNETVPGANDNLSSCAALPILARRLLADQPDDIELAFVVTGCEESGTGGAVALARQMRDAWPTNETVIIVLEVLANGRLRVLREGELWPKRIPATLLAAARHLAESDSRFGDLSVFQQPAGATDALPFLATGYAAMALGCIDDRTGTPGHYHLPSDSADNLDFRQLMNSIAFVEALVLRLMYDNRGETCGQFAPAGTLRRGAGVYQ